MKLLFHLSCPLISKHPIGHRLDTGNISLSIMAQSSVLKDKCAGGLDSGLGVINRSVDLPHYG